MGYVSSKESKEGIFLLNHTSIFSAIFLDAKQNED